MTFRLLPEWAEQDAIMLTWPHKDTDWADILDDVEPVYVTLCQQISQVQKVVIVAHNDDVKNHITQQLIQADVDLMQVQFALANCDDTWARDHGPLTCANEQGELAIKDFIFNGWGNKFDASMDNAINAQVVKQLAAPKAQYHPLNFVLEGGGVEINEHGTLLATRECLLNPNRNPDYSQLEIEQLLQKELGVKDFLWVDHGYLAGDDTDSHIDTLVRFAPNNTLVYVECDDEQDEHFSALSAMAAQLQSFTTAQGEPYRLVALPWPKAICDKDGYRLPATYANYLILNKTVLVPVYADENDAQALAQIQLAYPDRTVIGINCTPIIHQFGSLHCITMQLPRGFLK
ncbi:agmatine/peptidylarginine deiminase [Pseudoalteromonas fenneropenaei]|uniref:Agmatine/peptidylarginine deiminase n=1 Tax=Pseudoalteromonas fenneropenaei TaxID=1737459 RepID=A0ABV7CFD4_9GAMM